MTDDRSTDDPRTIAAEYALRLLSGEDARVARERARSDPDFAAEVARWHGRLAPLHAEIEEVAPPASLWKRIETSAELTASNDNAPAVRRQLSMWRAATAVMTAAAASLALILVTETTTRPAPRATPQHQTGTPMVAMLGDKGAMKVVASWSPSARQLILAVPGGLPSDPRHAHELWVIPSGGKPRSLGTLPAGKQMHMELAQAIAQLLSQGATIAISVEPPGGSPTGAPTGPVVAAGALTPA